MLAELCKPPPSSTTARAKSLFLPYLDCTLLHPNFRGSYPEARAPWVPCLHFQALVVGEGQAEIIEGSLFRAGWESPLPAPAQDPPLPGLAGACGLPKVGAGMTSCWTCCWDWNWNCSSEGRGVASATGHKGVCSYPFSPRSPRGACPPILPPCPCPLP